MAVRYPGLFTPLDLGRLRVRNRLLQTGHNDGTGYAITATNDVSGSVEPGWSDIRLVHEALPEVDLPEIDLSVDFLGRRLGAPLPLATPTGGHAHGEVVNARLARAAERHDLAMGVGSQRAALRRARSCLAAIAGLARELQVPLLVEETGAGLSRTTSARLASAGAPAIDVGGAGGTNPGRPGAGATGGLGARPSPGGGPRGAPRGQPVTLPAALAGVPQVLAVEDLPVALWERWPPRSLLRTRRWLQACRVPGDQALCVRTDAGDGLVAGRLVDRPDAWPRLNAVDVCAGALFGVAADAADVETARRVAVPHLLIAFPGYDTGLVGAPTAADAVVTAVASVASAAGALPAYVYLPPDEPLLASLRRAGYVTGLVAATALLDLAKPSFSAYLASLPRKRRNEMQRELRRFADAGATVEVLPAPAAAGVLDEVAELEASVSRHHGRPEAASRPAAVNARLAAAFGEDMLVVVARHRGRCVASATLFRHGDELHGRSAGIDHRPARPIFAHFVAAYATPVRIACDLGLHRVGFGIAAFPAKVARGARLVPLAAALPPDAPPSLLRLLERTDRCLRLSLPCRDVPE